MKQKGFTLIELMIVIAIIGILSVIAIPKFVDLVDKAKEASTMGNFGALRSAIAIYYGDNEGIYPYRLDNKSYTVHNVVIPPFVTKYMEAIPDVKLRRDVNHKNTNVVYYGYHDSGGWWYNPTDGKIRIDCGHKSLKGDVYYTY
ncbi:MAG: type II secretion system protein [Candidatus Omnitrophica bacterium]|nr:type II secretion system protein [Candidatus Omnitrophota bacterium]